MTETWVEIDGYPNYEVNQSGDVRNKKTQRILKPQANLAGYIMVKIHSEGKQKSCSVHRLVAHAFIGKPEGDKREVNHIDGNKANNHVSNLEYMTRLENVGHYWKHLHKPKRWTPSTIRAGLPSTQQPKR